MFVEIGYTNDNGQNKWSSATSFDCANKESGLAAGQEWASKFLEAAKAQGFISTIDYIEVSE